MKVKIEVTNDEGQIDFSHTYSDVEYFEVGGYQQLEIDMKKTGRWVPSKDESSGYHGSFITLVLKKNLPSNRPAPEVSIAPIEKP